MEIIGSAGPGVSVDRRPKRRRQFVSTPIRGFNVASFIAERDRIPAYLAARIYRDRPVDVFGFRYQPQMSDGEIGVWINCAHAIVVFRGTEVTTVENLIDDVVIATQRSSCALFLTQQGVPVLRDLFQAGFTMTLAGHSLGGRAAMCFGNAPGVERVVALNAGAPVTNPATVGPGPEKGVHYHVVGDLISTHVEPSAMHVVRVLLRDLPLNWLDLWFHSTERFLQDEDWTIVVPQFEQNSLEKFFFIDARLKLKALNLVTSGLFVNWYESVGDMICERPVPGAVAARPCRVREGGGAQFDKFAFGFLGAGFAFITGGLGAALGGYSAGAALSQADARGALGAVIPGYGQLESGVKKVVELALQLAVRGGKDPVEALEEAITKLETEREIV